MFNICTNKAVFIVGDNPRYVRLQKCELSESHLVYIKLSMSLLESHSQMQTYIDTISTNSTSMKSGLIIYLCFV